NHRARRRYLLRHHRVGTDACVVADRDRAENFGAAANQHAVTQRRMALAFIPAGAAERDTVIERDVVANFGGFADDDTGAVIDKKTLTDTRTGMNIDIADQTSDKGQQARRITPARQP